MNDYTEELKNKTITEILNENNLTLKELIKIQEQKNNPINNNKKNKNIHRQYNKHSYKEKQKRIPKNITKTYNNKYKIQRKGTYYGTYNTLQQAKKIKQELEKQDWNKKELDNILLKEGIIRYIIHTNKIK